MKKFIVFMLFIVFIFVTGCSPYIPILRGDCVDRSVIIRQSLKAQGYEAELVVGVWERPKSKDLYHCWVEYKNKKTGKWIKVRTEY